MKREKKKSMVSPRKSKFDLIKETKAKGNREPQRKLKT